MNRTETGGERARGGEIKTMHERWGEYLTYADAEVYMGGVSRTTIWRIIRRGDIEACKIGSAVRISRASIDRYLQNHPWRGAED